MEELQRRIVAKDFLDGTGDQRRLGTQERHLPGMAQQRQEPVTGRVDSRFMGDGWETRRRREPGHDWAVLRLGRPGTIDEIEVDTAHFRGNFPDRVSLQAALIDNIATEALENASATWPLLLPEQPMRADHQHKFKTELVRLGPVSHVRLNLHPDGGVSRLRLYGSSVHK